MQLLNRMIQGAKNWIGGNTSEESINVICIQLPQPAQRAGWSQAHQTREEAIAAAQAEIDAKIN